MNIMGKVLHNKKSIFAVVLYFVLIVIIYTFPLILNLHDTVHDPGDPVLNAYILGWDSQQILADPLNIYNANFFYPAELTLTFSEHMFAKMLYFFPVYILSGNPVLSLNISILIILFLTGFFTYLFVDYITGNKAAAIFCATAMIIGIPKMIQMGHFQLLGIEWFPLSLYLFERYINTGSKYTLLLLALVVFLQIMSSYYLAYMFLIFYFVYILFRIITTGFYKNRKEILLFAGNHLLVLLIFCLITLPYLSAKNIYNLARSIEESVYYSADLFSYFTLSSSVNIYRDFNLWLPDIAIHEKILFPGISIIILSLFALKAKSKYKKPLILSTAVMFVLSLGPFLQINNVNTHINLPYYLLYLTVPGFSSMRVPARFGMFVFYGLVFLSAFGMVKLLKYKYGKHIMVLLFLFLLICNFAYPYRTCEFSFSDYEINTYQYVQEYSAGAVLELPVHRKQPWLESRYMVGSLLHRRPIVNGYSGFFPQSYFEIIENSLEKNEFLDLQYLQKIGVDTVIIHSDKISDIKYDYRFIEDKVEYGAIKILKLPVNEIHDIDNIN